MINQQKFELLDAIPKQEVDQQLQFLMDDNKTGIPSLDAEAMQAIICGFFLGYMGQSKLVACEYSELGQGAEVGMKYHGMIIEGLDNIEERTAAAVEFSLSYNTMFNTSHWRSWSSHNAPGSWQDTFTQE
jgi:hypothetical protein